MNKLNILITGVGGDIGQSCGRILKNYDISNRVIGCDIHNEHPGISLFDSCEVVPKIIDSGYIKALHQLVKKYAINAVIPTSEPELRYFSSVSDSFDFDAIPLLMSSRKATKIGFDKLETSRFLKKNDIVVPWAVDSTEGDPLEFPCIFKSRLGAGNSRVYLLKNIHEVQIYKQIYSNYIFQEYIPSKNNEYTCGVYRLRDGEVRSIILRRRLASGITSYAEVINNKSISELCKQVANALQLEGSINIQLRLTSDGRPMIFEINPRFSSTVAFRHKLGFQDLIWSIQEEILGISPYQYISPMPNTKMFRVSNEVVED